MEILFMYYMFLVLINSFQLCFASIVSHWVAPEKLRHVELPK